MDEEEPKTTDELLDEETLAVLAILLAVSLEFGFGFAKTVDWHELERPVSSGGGALRDHRHLVGCAVRASSAPTRLTESV